VTAGDTLLSPRLRAGAKNRIELTTGADLVLDPDTPTRSRTAAERRGGVGWRTVFPASWRE
jgi:hypothetical protein